MFWIDFKGKEVSYGVLPLNGILNMSTYVTHPWVAKLKGTNNRMKIGGQDVFYPQPGHSGKYIEITGKGDGVLRSQRSDQKVTNVKFKNKNGVKVDLIWVDFKGNEKKGGVIPPGSQINGNTFVTHPFKAYISGTKKALKINGKEVFQPQVSDSNKDANITGGPAPNKDTKAPSKGAINVSSAKQSSNYSGRAYLANWAFMGPNKFTHTKKGRGQWWEVSFNQKYLVSLVKILNRKDCCGSRLNGTKVMIDNQVCGHLPNNCKNGQWYTVTCAKPIMGGKVRLVTTHNTWLHFSGI